VTDLKRLTASNKYVTPGHPDQSELWKEIDEGDMPPDKARAGPLTPAEKDAIFQWIVGGAPPLDEVASITATAAGPSLQPSRDPAPTEIAAPNARSQTEIAPSRLLALFGRFHVVLIHFPVAFIIVAAMVEAWNFLRPSAVVTSLGRMCLVLGAVAAIPAAALGWIHALDGFPGPCSDPMSIAGLHRWIGTAVGVIAPAVAIFSERDARRGKRSPILRWAILVLAALVGVAGHFGGLLTHGSGYFDL
jgi:uncharacterized membrane protein